MQVLRSPTYSFSSELDHTNHHHANGSSLNDAVYKVVHRYKALKDEAATEDEYTGDNW